MATSTTAKASKPTEQILFEWEGTDRQGKKVHGELRASNETAVRTTLRSQGTKVTKIKRRRMVAGKKIKDRDIVVLTRQMATMMKAGVPLLQAFDIVGRGHPNPSLTLLLETIRRDVEAGTSLSGAFRKHPRYFDTLYCDLVRAGETAGILESLLDRLAVYKEKTLMIKAKIKSALMYPSIVFTVSLLVVALIMIFVVPTFKQMFSQFGASLPAPTLVVMAMSEFFVKYWFILLSAIGGGLFAFFRAWRDSLAVQEAMDRFLLKIPVFGPLIRMAAVARWTRTLSTMFAAGVPLVEALESVAGAAGNRVYWHATNRIQREVSTGTSLTTSMDHSGVFPSMVLQMSAIGEESGALDTMLAKVADFYESEVDEAVAGLSSMMEPLIITVLGSMIGGIMISMYMPIFKMGSVT